MEESNVKFLIQQCRDLLSMCESTRDRLYVGLYIIPVIGPIIILRRILRGWPLQWEYIIDPWTNRPMEGVDPSVLRRYELYYPSPYWSITMTPEEEAEKQVEEERERLVLSEQDALVEDYVRKLAEATNYVEGQSEALPAKKSKSPWAAKRDAWRAKRQIEEEEFDDEEMDGDEEVDDEETQEPEIVYVDRPTRQSDSVGKTLAVGLAGFALGRLAASSRQQGTSWTQSIRDQCYNRGKSEREYNLDQARERWYKDQWLKDHVSKN